MLRRLSSSRTQQEPSWNCLLSCVRAGPLRIIELLRNVRQPRVTFFLSLSLAPPRLFR